jgi:hypothetical protein
VGVGQPTSDLGCVASGSFDGQSAPLTGQIAERAAFHVLHGNIGLACGLADLIDYADMGVIQMRERQRLLPN